jgi:5-methylcytosine-specific restriction endonuclease McrA
MTSLRLLESLSDDELIAETKRLVAAERVATAALLRSLMELDTRRLYLREGCSSLFTYCTQVLHLAEGAAYNRIEAARAARRFPIVLDALANGLITLTTIRLLAPHLTDGNHRELVAAAHHKSKHDVEWLIATINPRPAVPALIRAVPARPPAPETVRTMASASGPTTPPMPPRPRVGSARAAPAAGEVKVLSVDSYKLQVTLSRSTHDKLRRAQDLLRHTIPTGDLASLLDRAVTLLLADLERRRCAATPTPRAAATGPGRSRHIPAAVKRAVWQRDQGRCAFIGASGRCRETAFLEFHHVEPFAEGGRATVENLQVRCKAHNLYGRSTHWSTRESRGWRTHGRCSRTARPAPHEPTNNTQARNLPTPGIGEPAGAP